MSSSTVDLAINGFNKEILEEEEEEYDLSKYRQVKKPVSTIGSFFNLLKGHLGAGILAIPFALSQTGLLLGSIFIFCIGLIYGHCIYLLVITAQKLCKRMKIGYLNYGDTAEKSFDNGAPWMKKYAKMAKICVQVCIITTALDGSIIMTVAASTFQGIFSKALHVDWDVRIFILLVAIPGFIVSQVRYLKIMAPFSALATTFIMTMLVITIYYIFREPFDVHNGVKMVESITKWPTFFSILAFAYGGIGLILPVEQSMMRPQYFLGCPGISYTATSSLTLIYWFIGASGYARYGSEIESSISINLPTDETLSILSNCLICTALMLSIGLIFQYFMDTIWSSLEKRIPKKRHNISQIGIRFSFTLVMLVLALVVPDIEVLMSIIGAVSGSTLSFIFPAAIHTAYIYPNFGRFKWKLWKNVLIIIFGLFILIAGLFSGVLDIIDLYSS